jgi:hypothetical protein
MALVLPVKDFFSKVKKAFGYKKEEFQAYQKYLKCEKYLKKHS